MTEIRVGAVAVVLFEVALAEAAVIMDEGTLSADLAHVVEEVSIM